MDDYVAEVRSRFWKTVIRPAAAAIAIVVLIVWAFYTIRAIRPHHMLGLDFSCYYTWAIACRQHINPYRTDLTQLGLRNRAIVGPIKQANYPPTFLLLSEPLAYFSPFKAHSIWIVVSVALLVAAIVILLERDLPFYLIAIAVSLSFLYRPTYIHFQFGQAQILITFALVVVLCELERGREITAGIILGFAGLLKAYPLFMVICLVCDRRWRGLAATFVTVIFGFGLTLIVLGPLSLGFFAHLSRVIAAGPGVPMLPMVSIAGTVERGFEYFISAADTKSRFALLVHLIAASFEIGIFGCAAILAIRLHTRNADIQNAFGLFIATMVLLIPGAWPHYMVLLLIPLGRIAIASYRDEAPHLAVALGIAAFVVPELGYSGGFLALREGHPVLGNVLMEGMFVSTILTWIAAYLLAAYPLRRHAAPAAQDHFVAQEQSQLQPCAAETR